MIEKLYHYKEMDCFDAAGLGIETTKDGSLTLRFGAGESMHHSGGAAAETNYIYGESIRQIVDQQNWSEAKPLKILVVGFGLGYIELMNFVYLTEVKKLPLSAVQIVSFEKMPILYESFSNWLTQVDSSIETMRSLFDDVLGAILKELSLLNIQPKDIRRNFLNFYQMGYWRPEAAIVSSEQIKGDFSVIQYDAFSSKTDCDLWTEEFLMDLFKGNVSEHSVLATYACTSLLKRTAIASGWTPFKRPGFLGKRNSSIITKGFTPALRL